MQHTKTRLPLRRETLRALATHQIAVVRGGFPNRTEGWTDCPTDGPSLCADACSNREHCGSGDSGAGSGAC